MKKQEPVLPEGFILGKYRIISFIAEGAMGQVYEAEHMVLNKRHAIKVIRKSLAENEEFITRFRYEARIMAALEHENIVHVTDYGHEEGHPYFVMDFVGEANKASRTLQEDLGRRDNRKALSEDRVQNLALQICSALAYAHMFEGEGMVHRDLKPGNILLRNDPSRGERVVVTDFGLARMLTEDDRLVTRIFSGDSQIVDDGTGKKLITEEIAGTPAFMSPEQWNAGAEIGPSSDIYSLGVIIYRALTSEYPYIDSRALLGLRDEPPMRKASSFGCSPRWDAVIDKCLKANPGHRYASAMELAEDIKLVLEPEEKPKKSKLPLISALLLICASSLYFGKDYIKQYLPQSSATATNELIIPSEPVEDLTVAPAVAAVEEPEPAPVIIVTQEVAVVEPEPPTPPEPVELEISTVLERGAVQPPMLPKSGMIRIDDNPWRKVSIPHVQNFNVDETYQIALDIPGYNVTPIDPVSLKEGDSPKAIRFNIAPRMVEFKIISNVADAKLRRGGQIVGRVNEYIIVKPYEDFELQIEADGFINQNLFIDALDPTRPSVSRHITLQPYPSEIEITGVFPDLFSKEEKVEIFLNGKSHGYHKLPYRAMNLTPQTYSVEIKASDYEPIKAAAVELGPGSRKAVAFKLLYRPAKVVLDLMPTNAVVSIKGEEHHERTIELNPGMYKLQITAPGHRSQVVSTRLRAGEVKEYKSQLEPLTYLHLEITPATTSIYMKNKKVHGPDIHMDPGVSYELEFRASGHKTKTKTYRLTRGQILNDEVILKKKFF